MAWQMVQGRTFNHLTWCFVDSVDFATRESAMSAAAKIKVYGKVEGNSGVFFVSSGTGSLSHDIKHVGSSAAGLYTIALTKADLSDASNVWYDEYYFLLSAAGAAYETIIAEGVRTDTSYLSTILSDIYSALNAGVQLNASSLSDIRSAITAGVGNVTVSNISDIASAVGDTLASRLSDILSRTVATYSLLTSRVPDVTTTGPDLVSAVWGYPLTSRVVTVSPSDMSDIRSLVTAGVGNVTVSNISDIASAVWATPLATKLVQLNSSDLSDLRSAIGSGGGTVSVSNISDIASAVWAYPLTSRVTTLSPSDMSDLRSAITGQSQASDIYSLLTAINTTVLGMSDMLSDTLALVSSLDSDIQSRFPATIPELTADPGATPTWAKAQALQYMWLRANTRKIVNAAGTTVASAAVSWP